MWVEFAGLIAFIDAVDDVRHAAVGDAVIFVVVACREQAHDGFGALFFNGAGLESVAQNSSRFSADT